MLLNEKDGRIKDEFRGDFELIKDQVSKIEQEITDLKEIITGGKTAPATYSEFLEVLKKMPLFIREIKSLSELDFFMKKIFSNLTVNGKKVIKTTLAAPFDKLYKLSNPALLPDKDSNLN